MCLNFLYMINKISACLNFLYMINRISTNIVKYQQMLCLKFQVNMQTHTHTHKHACVHLLKSSKSLCGRVQYQKIDSETQLEHTATYCQTLQHTATHCNTLQHTATHCNTRRHTARHCNTLQDTATHCNTLQHTATHLIHMTLRVDKEDRDPRMRNQFFMLVGHHLAVV